VRRVGLRSPGNTPVDTASIVLVRSIDPRLVLPGLGSVSRRVWDTNHPTHRCDWRRISTQMYHALPDWLQRADYLSNRSRLADRFRLPGADAGGHGRRALRSTTLTSHTFVAQRRGVVYKSGCLTRCGSVTTNLPFEDVDGSIREGASCTVPAGQRKRLAVTRWWATGWRCKGRERARLGWCQAPAEVEAGGGAAADDRQQAHA
jgi:hypothetical protein